MNKIPEPESGEDPIKAFNRDEAARNAIGADCIRQYGVRLHSARDLMSQRGVFTKDMKLDFDIAMSTADLRSLLSPIEKFEESVK